MTSFYSLLSIQVGVTQPMVVSNARSEGLKVGMVEMVAVDDVQDGRQKVDSLMARMKVRKQARHEPVRC